MRIVLISCKGYHTGRNVVWGRDEATGPVFENAAKVLSETEITPLVFADRETGVSCLFALMRYAGGLTPLLDADGSWL